MSNNKLGRPKKEDGEKVVPIVVCMPQWMSEEIKRLAESQTDGNISEMARRLISNGLLEQLNIQRILNEG